MDQYVWYHMYHRAKRVKGQMDAAEYSAWDSSREPLCAPQYFYHLDLRCAPAHTAVTRERQNRLLHWQIWPLTSISYTTWCMIRYCATSSICQTKTMCCIPLELWDLGAERAKSEAKSWLGPSRLSCACLYACQRTCQWNVLHTLKWLRPWLRRSPTNSIDLWGVSKCPSSLHQTPQACLDHDKVKEHAGPACTSTQKMIIWYNDIVYDMVSSCYHDITSIIRYHMIYIMLYHDIMHKTTVVPFLCSVYHDMIYAAKYIMT